MVSFQRAPGNCMYPRNSQHKALCHECGHTLSQYYHSNIILISKTLGKVEERNGKKWKEIERHGKKWKEMERNGKKWKEMERNGKKPKEMERMNRPMISIPPLQPPSTLHNPSIRSSLWSPWVLNPNPVPNG